MRRDVGASEFFVMLAFVGTEACGLGVNGLGEPPGEGNGTASPNGSDGENIAFPGSNTGHDGSVHATIDSGGPASTSAARSLGVPPAAGSNPTPNGPAASGGGASGSGGGAVNFDASGWSRGDAGWGYYGQYDASWRGAWGASDAGWWSALDGGGDGD